MKQILYPFLLLFLFTGIVEAKAIKILAFGDSITFGNGVTAQESYPAQLQKISKQYVINAGLPGENSTEALQRLKRVLQREKGIDIMILCHGANDILHNKSKSILANNIQKMIETAQKRGIKVLLIGVVNFNFQDLQTLPLYKDLATKYHTAYNGEILKHIEADPQLKSDPIHPNAKGYAKMAKAIFDSLNEAKFLK